jgi:tRNA dimethylallyltransferase
MKTLAIIGQSASGKTSAAHNIARETNAALLSMDSLSVYRHIDVASAKPTEAERDGLTYFGLDIADPRDRFGADEFIAEFLRAKAFCEETDRDLIIVGGSGFYLKAITSGLSPIPAIDAEIKAKVLTALNDLSAAYNELKTIDPICAAKIAPKDRYRIEKALLIAYAGGKTPSAWFAAHPPRAILQNAPIAVLTIPVETLRAKIALRTKKMLADGLIDEVENLLTNAPRSAQPMKAIGVKETIDYIDGKISVAELENLINIHTSQFAKRQRVYNNGRFDEIVRLSADEIETFGLRYFGQS